MFSRANPFDESVIAATNENLTVENWELILAVTDKLSRASTESARDCIAAVEKRLNNKNPNVQLYALALTEALVKNCDITVHREICSRSFTNTLTKLVHDKTVHSKVQTRILEFIQMCSFEFRADSTLGLMNEVYHSLRAEGIQFPSPQKPKKEFTQSELDKQKEEEELQLALALSLSESENRSSYKSSATPASTNQTAAVAKSTESAPPQISRVRALYDFQPTEQGELGFEKGDIIRVIESVYRDWWKGELRGKTGIFPVNYVEKIVDPSPSDLLKEASVENEVINETRNIDRLLEMLSSTDPRIRESFSDNEELQNLYNTTLSIRPKLVKLIEKYSLKKDELVALNEKFMQARTMYDGMLSNSIARYSAQTAAPGGPYGGYPPYGNYGYQPGQPYTGQPQQSPYGYQQPPSSQPQVQSPAPQNQPAQQPAYSYNNEQPTPQMNATNPPQQQQSPYDYNQQQQAPQQPYQASYENYQPPPPQPQQQTSDYGYPTVAPPAHDHATYSPAAQQQQQQQQQNYAAYAPPAVATPSSTEGYPPTHYPPQQPYIPQTTNPGYQAQQNYNY
ncbi:uncharacterized protein B0P05DRAFT_508528 [Gilbertella persicaria]|uniref:uncharacterized protein n=1 Tax=Gilbertella persicaria TaxID=101096 RepID=UPI00221EACE9|nr:uncharacterized protein B0P05DRAFT_508528 [Gilbertella persicaria]KAI8082653.1 hypothetical protein B0P05DRAFT_508528 [Gilbertella persicaria]